MKLIFGTFYLDEALGFAIIAIEQVAPRKVDARREEAHVDGHNPDFGRVAHGGSPGLIRHDW